MSQRNPLNDRYQTDDRKGQTRKSAAAAKPKAKAASSVRVISTEKSPKQKKAAARAKRQQESNIERQYYHPPWPEYTKWKRIWWICLACAIGMTAGSLAVSYIVPTQQVISNTMIGLGYAFLIGFLFVDFAKIRKIRRRYQAEMKAQAKTTKGSRAEQKKEHAAAVAARNAAKQAAEEKAAAPVKLESSKRALSLESLKEKYKIVFGKKKTN